VLVVKVSEAGVGEGEAAGAVGDPSVGDELTDARVDVPAAGEVHLRLEVGGGDPGLTVDRTEDLHGCRVDVETGHVSHSKRPLGRRQRRRVPSVADCAACARANIDEARFCAHCGAALADRCPHCGAELPGDVAFCPSCGTALVAAATTEERRFLTILFVDLVGFTAESDEADPEDVRARLVPYHQRVREEIERYEGTVEKLIGDGVMAVFGVPISHEDDPERAVRVALRIQEAVGELNESHTGLNLVVRVGINSGEAVVTTGGQGERIVGDVVNTASRLESVAPPGGVVVGETTHRATDLMIEYDELEPVEVKGKSRSLAIWRAVEPRGRYGVDAAVRVATPFLGRDKEMAVLTETFHRVLEDRSIQLVTIAAAPGVGKSRLVNEFWQWVDDRPEILWWRQGRCLPYGEGITFWALGEVIKGQAGIRESDGPKVAEEKLVTALVALTEDPGDRDWLLKQLGPLVGVGAATQSGDRAEAFTAWRRFLEDMAATQPLIMVIEDLHWADAALVEFLEDLLVWSADAPIMVICTARPELYETHPAWGGGQRNSTTLSLATLSDEHIARLISALLDQAVLPAETQRALLDRAGGNPLYAEEFVRMLNDREMLHGHGRLDALGKDAIPVPETVQALIGSRLDILSEAEATVIQDASVVGKVFWEGVLSDIGGGAEVRRPLRQLVEREWIRPVRNSSVEGQQEYAFWHALTRDVAYGRIPRSSRSQKHRAVAEWIEASAADRASDHAELLAHHYLSALEAAEAAGEAATPLLRVEATRTLEMAGDRAVRLDTARGVGYYEIAASLMAPDDPDRPGVLIKAGIGMGDLFDPAGLEILEEAAKLAKALGNRVQAGSALQEVSRARWFRGGAGAGKATLDEAIELLEAEPPSEHLAAAYVSRAGGYMFKGRSEEQLEWSDKALAVAEELGFVEGVARALSIRGIARFHLGDPQGGIADLRRSLELAETMELGAVRLSSAFVNLANHIWMESGPAAALEIYERCIEVVESRGTRAFWSRAEMMWVLFDLGRWDEVLALSDWLIDSEGETGSTQLGPWAHSYRAAVSVWRGDVAGAVDQQPLYLPALREIEDLQLLAPALAITARIEVTRGDLGEATELIRELAAVTEGRAPLYRAMWAPEATRILVASGHIDEATEFVLSAESAPGRRNVNMVAAAEAILAEARGEIEDAAAQYDTVAAVWEEFGHRLEEALALYGAGRCLATLGRGDEALNRFRRAQEILTELGAQPTVAEIDSFVERASGL